MSTSERNRLGVENGAKRIRVYLGGELIADTTRVKLVWEKPYYPTYYFPEADVRTELLTATDNTTRSPSRGVARHFNLKGGDRVAEHGAYTHPDSPIEELRGLIAFRWEAMDNWFEEEEEVFVHARDPHTRVEILRSSRHIEVVINGVKIADSHSPTLLFETGLPTRYYLPLIDLRLDLLEATDTKTYCPYKGEATYWSVEADGETLEDIVWAYRYPVRESAPIAGLAAFYNEKVDIYVDGELEERPRTHFS